MIARFTIIIAAAWLPIIGLCRATDYQILARQDVGIATSFGRVLSIPSEQYDDSIVCLPFADSDGGDDNSYYDYSEDKFTIVQDATLFRPLLTDGALVFDGSNDFARKLGVNSGYAKYIGFWLKPASWITASAPQQAVVCFDETDAYPVIALGSYSSYLVDETATLSMQVGAAMYRTAITNNISPDWHYVAFSWSDVDGQFLVYLDGEEVPTMYGTSAGHIQEDHVWVEDVALGSTFTSSRFLNGAVDDVLVLTNGLPETAIADIYSKGRSE